MSNIIKTLFCMFVISSSLLSGEIEDFAEKLKPLASQDSISADFIQTRHIANLNFDMKFQGRMLQQISRHLKWETLKPVHTIYVISRDSFMLWDAATKKSTVLNAEKMPWIPVMFNMQAQWMQGNLEAIRKNFVIEVKDDHTLQLKPNTKMAVQMDISITFSDDYTYIRTMVFTEASGDYTRLEFSNFHCNAAIEESEWTLPQK